ncbi:MAG: hypothetical protein NT166_14420 [Candidatus Aminicenantes bacterium]|nr:hypothetical protein [Candidatus Aminicenantes bacterium]
MKIDLTPAASLQAELIADMDVIETGFLMGSVFGKHIIVEQLFPVNFNEGNIADIYGKMMGGVGEKLLGVFFNNRAPFPSDWFLEDVIIKINPLPLHRQPEFYIYDVEKNFVSLGLSGGSDKQMEAL